MFPRSDLRYCQACGTDRGGWQAGGICTACHAHDAVVRDTLTCAAHEADCHARPANTGGLHAGKVQRPSRALTHTKEAL